MTLAVPPDEPATEPFPDDVVAAITATLEDRRACRGRPGAEEERADLPDPDGEHGGSESWRPAWTDLIHEPPVRPFVPRFRPGVTPAPPDFRMLVLDLLQEPLAAEMLPPCGFPWTTVGRVESGLGEQFDGWTSYGTGTLVGPNLLLTASHLHQWERPPGGWWMRFKPGFADGVSYGLSYVERVRGYRIDDTGDHDYLICKLYEPLGQWLGWMGSQSFGDDDRYEDPLWLSVGYPGVYLDGRFPVLETNIGVEDVDDESGGGRELEVDYSVTFGGGWSGGPLFGPIGGVGGDYRVVGVKSGSEADGYDPVRGVFAGGRPMVELVKHGWANWQ